MTDDITNSTESKETKELKLKLIHYYNGSVFKIVDNESLIVKFVHEKEYLINKNIQYQQSLGNFKNLVKIHNLGQSKDFVQFNHGDSIVKSACNNYLYYICMEYLNAFNSGQQQLFSNEQFDCIYNTIVECKAKNIKLKLNDINITNIGYRQSNEIVHFDFGRCEIEIDSVDISLLDKSEIKKSLNLKFI